MFDVSVPATWTRDRYRLKRWVVALFAVTEGVICFVATVMAIWGGVYGALGVILGVVVGALPVLLLAQCIDIAPVSTKGSTIVLYCAGLVGAVLGFVLSIGN